MIYITGDLHGVNESTRLLDFDAEFGYKLTKEDYLIICGDSGLIWGDTVMEMKLRTWLSTKNWTTLFVDGCHENFPKLNMCPSVPMFDSTVHKISEDIYHLKRGEVYNICGKKVFTFGGGMSRDKSHRVEGLTWWSDEEPNGKDMERGINNLVECDYDVDLVLTHTCPYDIIDTVADKKSSHSLTEKYLDFVYARMEDKNVDYKWHFGYFHKDKIINSKMRAMYCDVIKI